MFAPAVIIAKRKSGLVRIAYVKTYGEPLEQTISHLGLGNSPVEGAASKLRSILYDEALSIISQLLHQDMAYHATQMPHAEAQALATDFLAPFSSNGARFLTNRGVPLDESRPHDIPWNPMTGSTFDSGVICLSVPVTGCIWFEDED